MLACGLGFAQDVPPQRRGKKGMIGESTLVVKTPPVASVERQPIARDPRASQRISPRASSKSVAPSKKALPTSKAGDNPRTESKPVSNPRTESKPVNAPRIEDEPPPPFSSTPVLAPIDRIEVIEWGSTRSSNRPSGSSAGGEPTRSPRPIVSTRRIEVEIDAPRIIQIQQALTSRGFLTGEPTGLYDELTIEAMRQFQISQKIDATGYPTAHALKRLGL